MCPFSKVTLCFYKWQSKSLKAFNAQCWSRLDILWTLIGTETDWFQFWFVMLKHCRLIKRMLCQTFSRHLVRSSVIQSEVLKKIIQELEVKTQRHKFKIKLFFLFTSHYIKLSFLFVKMFVVINITTFKNISNCKKVCVNKEILC